MSNKEMIKHEKENLANGLITEELIYACLMTCEKTISTYAYKEKKLGNYYYNAVVSAGDGYSIDKLTWMEHRKKLQSLLLDKYPMKEIIQNTKSTKVYTDTAPKTLVKATIDLIDTGKYEVCL